MITAGVSLNYSYPERDDRHRIKTRQANVGRSWTDLLYDDADQLTSANAAGRAFAYHFDGQGNRDAQGTVASHVVHPLDQIRTRTLSSRGFGVYGAVDPLAQLRVTHALSPNGQELAVHPQTGEFYGWWNLPSDAGEQVDVVVRGSLAGAGTDSQPAVAEKEIRLLVPPVQESFSYDSAGRIKTDASWTYIWDGPGRLKQMVRNTARLRERGSISEVVDYDYDSDGRRTRKTRTVTFPDRVRVESSRILWTGWLPILEERSRDGEVIDKRWFQWGADMSGSLEGAGGIGGLVAIIEEKPGKPTRTLWPVQDGLGNVTAVLDAVSGKIVARYDFGPFGEPLGEYGESDVCPFRWQTKWYDEESEHYYFGYRDYSPRLGRWLSRDPLGEAGGFNLYAYCGNDPVNKHDPTGLSPAPFTPQVFDQDAGAGMWNYQSTDPAFLLTQIAKAAQLNAWLDAQSGEIAAVQGGLMEAQADAAALRALSLRVPGGPGAMLGMMSAFFGGPTSGGRNLMQQIRWAQMGVGAEIGQLQGRLGTLLDEAQPWFDASGNLYGDLDGNGRIAGRAELSRLFQTRVVSVGMHDQTFDLLNDIGVVQAGIQIPRALGGLTTSAARRVAPNWFTKAGDPFSAMAKFRARSNLTSDDTLAVAIVDGKYFFGVNSGASSASLALRRGTLGQMQQAGMFGGRHLGQVQALTHAEAHALMRAQARLGNLQGKNVQIFVDRATCNHCFGVSGLPSLSGFYGIGETIVVSPIRAFSIFVNP